MSAVQFNVEAQWDSFVLPSGFKLGIIKPILKGKHGDISCTNMYAWYNTNSGDL